MFSDEDVRQCETTNVGSDVVRDIMAKTAELLAARGGTMAAEHLAETRAAWLGREGEGDVEDMLEHISALGARNAVLERDTLDARAERDAVREDVVLLRERLHSAEESVRELTRRAQQAEAERDRWQKEHSAMTIQAKDAREEARALKARCATRSAAGQALSEHVDEAEACVFSDTLARYAVLPLPAKRYPCSSTCTHDDAATPGHPERVKERSEAFTQALPEMERTEAYDSGAEAMRSACLNVVQIEMEKRGCSREEWESMKSAIEGAAP